MKQLNQLEYRTNNLSYSNNTLSNLSNVSKVKYEGLNVEESNLHEKFIYF